MPEPVKVVRNLYLQFRSTADDGMHLDMVQANELGEHTYDEPNPIASICTDEAGGLLLHLYTDFGELKVALAEIERAMVVARENSERLIAQAGAVLTEKCRPRPTRVRGLQSS